MAETTNKNIDCDGDKKGNSAFDKYKKDIDKLLSDAGLLEIAIQCECFPEQIKAYEDLFAKKGEKLDLQTLLPSFKETYQAWYSQVKALVRQLMPDRLDDLVRHYEKPKSRREIDFESYRIEDYLQGVTVTRGIYNEKVVGPEAAIPHFRQQIAILKAVKSRFESSLYDIRTLVQADVFDSEVEAARELAKNGYLRAAGAICGVLIEAHLHQVIGSRLIKFSKKNPGISDLSNALKEAGIIDTAQWRFIQHLADIRNLCDHKKASEPTKSQIQDLLDGTAKILKTVI